MSKYEPRYIHLFDDEAVAEMADQLGPILEGFQQAQQGSLFDDTQRTQQQQTAALYRAIGDVSAAHDIPPAERVGFALAGLEMHSLRQMDEGLSAFREVIEPMMMAFYDEGTSDD